MRAALLSANPAQANPYIALLIDGLEQRAAPLAARLKLTPEVVAASKAADIIAKIQAHADDIVFVVGHSNTVPAIIKALGGPELTIGDNEYDNLFIYVPATKALTRIRY